MPPNLVPLRYNKLLAFELYGVYLSLSVAFFPVFVFMSYLSLSLGFVSLVH